MKNTDKAQLEKGGSLQNPVLDRTRFITSRSVCVLKNQNLLQILDELFEDSRQGHGKYRTAGSFWNWEIRSRSRWLLILLHCYRNDLWPERVGVCVCNSQKRENLQIFGAQTKQGTSQWNKLKTTAQTVNSKNRGKEIQSKSAGVMNAHNF